MTLIREWLCSFPDDISIKTNRSRFVHLAVDTLNLGLETWEDIGALLEDFQVFNHRPCSFAEPFPRNDGRDARRIDNEERCRNAPLDLIDWQIIDIVAHEMPGGLARRHDHLRYMVWRKLCSL